MRGSRRVPTDPVTAPLRPDGADALQRAAQQKVSHPRLAAALSGAEETDSTSRLPAPPLRLRRINAYSPGRVAALILLESVRAAALVAR